jgi:hypothetical protein
MKFALCGGFFMKKMVLAAVIALVVAGITFAQGWGNPRGGYAEAVTVNGTLQLRDGVIIVESGNQAYYVPGLERYIGFIEGLKEGETVVLEGYIGRNSNHIEPTKMTVNGKSYDFTANAPGWTPNNGRGRGSYVSGHGRPCCW